MKFKRAILSVITVTMMMVILSLSTGFTIIIHSCSMSGSQSLNTEFFNNFNPQSVSCCCTNTSDDNGNIAIIKDEDCCKTSVEKIKINNYLPVDKAKVLFSSVLIAEIAKKDNPGPALNKSSYVAGNAVEKYGGRSIITCCHQFLI